MFVVRLNFVCCEVFLKYEARSFMLQKEYPPRHHSWNCFSGTCCLERKTGCTSEIPLYNTQFPKPAFHAAGVTRCRDVFRIRGYGVSPSPDAFRQSRYQTIRSIVRKAWPSLNPFFADNHITSSIFAVRNRRTPMNGNHSAASAGLILK